MKCPAPSQQSCYHSQGIVLNASQSVLIRFTGTNTHAILEQAPAPKSRNNRIKLPKAYPFILSAKSKNSLHHLIQDYRNFLVQTEESIEDISYTVAIGRSHFNYRCALTVSSIKNLIKQLDKADFVIYKAKTSEEEFSSKNLQELIAAYVEAIRNETSK